MSGEEFLDIPKSDETQQSTPEENYFSRSKNQWLLVSDMSDTKTVKSSGPKIEP